MKNKDIYHGALRILSESMVDGANDDYEERAPYIIAAFCNECRDADAAYRRANSLGEAAEVNAVYVDLNDDFPCAPRFSSACCTYLAAMLIIDQDSDLSDRLYDKYSDMMSSICAGIPASVERISERYL